MSWDILSKANLQYLLTRLKEVTDSIKRGHTIKDDSGTSLAQKDDMQFGGVYSHNDGTTTKVDIVREFNSPSDVAALTGEAAKGFQHTPDTVYKGRTASDIGFDKTGTSFNSTRVQDVLEEVDSKINGNIYIGDLDNLTDTGVYGHTVTENSNAPSDVNIGSILSISVLNPGTGLITQILYYGHLNIYVRRKYSGSWNDWKPHISTDSLFYKKGDTLTLYGNDTFAGRLGWNGKKLLFTVPLCKPIADDVTSITDNISSIYLCTASAATNASNLTNTSVVTKSIAKRGSYLLFIYEFANVPTSSALDAVCNVMMNGTYTVTFS